MNLTDLFSVKISGFCIVIDNSSIGNSLAQSVLKSAELPSTDLLRSTIFSS